MNMIIKVLDSIPHQLNLNLFGEMLTLALAQDWEKSHKYPANCTFTKHKTKIGRTIIAKTRGGVEDTRLEAKAKDTKKIRGQGQDQGQPFRGQTLSKPRTGMLEAKAKDQGHKRKCSPKKKGFHKNFLGDLQKKKVFLKKFSSDLLKKTLSKKFFKRFTKFLQFKN